MWLDIGWHILKTVPAKITEKRNGEPDAVLPSQKVLRMHFRDLALRIALHCVRNTVNEDYHAAGKLNDSEMAVLNREATNKIYSFLEIAFNPRYDAVRRDVFEWLYVPRWDVPTFDKSFGFLVRRIRQKTITAGERS